MNLEEKFMEVIKYSKGDYAMYLAAHDNGYVKLEYRSKWDDGLGNKSQIRIINPRMGISTAPPTWDRVMRSLNVNGVKESDFEAGLDRRIDLHILSHHRGLNGMRESFGDGYVDKIIHTRGKRSFTEDMLDLWNSMTKRTEKPKPGLTLVKEETT